MALLNRSNISSNKNAMLDYSLRNGVPFVLAWVAWVAWVECYRGWRANLGCMFLLLLLLLSLLLLLLLLLIFLLLLLKYYPEEKCNKC